MLTIVKSLGLSDQKWCIATILLEHCDFAVGALRLCIWCIATRLGAFRSWGIQAEGHFDYNLQKNPSNIGNELTHADMVTHIDPLPLLNTTNANNKMSRRLP